MADPKSSLGARIKSIRKMKGLSQVQTAERAGIDPKSLSRIESDVFNPAVDTLEGLASALGISTYEFFVNESDLQAVRRSQLIGQIVQAPDEKIEELGRAINTVLAGR